MKKVLATLFCCLALATLIAYAQTDEGFQMAKIVAFERVASDVQHPEKADSYKMSLRIADAVYNCTGHGPVSTFMDWTTTKEVPAKVDVKAKTIQVKNFDGKLIELKITGTKKSK